jgi:hypothetical protein
MVVSGVDAKAFAFEEAFEQSDQAAVVVDNEQTIHRIHFAFSGARRR